MKFDFIVIGSGLSGLTSAIVLQKKGLVLLVTKSALSDTATNLAQGGISAVVSHEDSFQSHIEDTLQAGAFHNNKQAVNYMVRNAPHAIAWLVDLGVQFEMQNGHFAPTLEAAHCRRRVLRATDFTGRQIEKALVQKVSACRNIAIWDNCFVLKLLVERKKCFGVQLIRNDGVKNIFSRSVILATGGVGQVYLWTTNPKGSTGDGLAMAKRAGCQTRDLEFIQFHPTALRHGRSPLFLLSEALRGEGAYLIDGKGERFMEGIDPRKELAPRDIVARAIYSRLRDGEVFLDITRRGQKYIKKRFPNIYQELKKRGFDLADQPVPVTPAAHYSCGGIKTDLFGRTDIAGLFAFGEVAGSGAQGANRLASNSLLEAVVFPLRLPHVLHELPSKAVILSSRANPPTGGEVERSSKMCSSSYNVTKQKLQTLMWQKVGIVRKKEELLDACRQIEKWERQSKEIKETNISLAEMKNMLLVSRLITASAIKRKKSLGAHYII